MFQVLQKNVGELSTEIKLASLEMKQTREIVSKYNGLREKIDECSDEIEALKNKAAGRSSVGKAIREWGGWIVGIISLIIALFKVFGG